MEVTGGQNFPVSRSTVWDHLFQAELLEEHLPGAKKIEQISEDVFEGEITRSLASITINMELAVEIESDDRPEEVSFQILGSDNRTGSELRGAGTIEIENTDDGSVVLYDLRLNFAGRVASLGPRLIKRQLNSDLRSFFGSFEKEISESRSR